MLIDVIALPVLARPEQIHQRAVIVFDVLRATTTITAALQIGVRQIRVFDSIEKARAARQDEDSGALLCGEMNCLAPAGFDLGNSPGAFLAERHAGKTLLMSTTNGTRAILVARDAKLVLAGALINADAVASVAGRSGLNITLLCAGTNGQIALEDLLGAGAVIEALQKTSNAQINNDAARIALQLFTQDKHRLGDALAGGQGGKNVLAAGLDDDIAFAARLNSSTCVGKIDPLAAQLCIVRA